MVEGWPDILIVEDEESFIDGLVVGLSSEKFRVRVAREGREALDQFVARQPDLILLDVVLPDMSGVDVCRSIRRSSDVPIIMVSARDSEVDIVVGLEVGANDYVAKPYRLRELVARMRAALRHGAHPSNGSSDPLLGTGDLQLDRERREITFRGQPMRLPLKEFELLEVLMANAGKVVARRSIIERVWGAGYVGDTKTLDVHVKRLRARLEDDRNAPRRIVTIRGVGYRYDPVPESEIARASAIPVNDR